MAFPTNYIKQTTVSGVTYDVFAKGMSGAFYDENSQVAILENVNNAIKLQTPLVIHGGDGAAVGKLSLDHSDHGQITDDSTATLFGFITNTALTVGSNNYSTSIRGSSISFNQRPAVNGINVVISSDLLSYVTLAGSSLETISGPKNFTGIVQVSPDTPGVQLGLDNSDSPNANISIVSANSAAYIDMGTPNVDYGFRIIKWKDTYNGLAQLVYGSNGGAITIPSGKTDTMAVLGDITSALSAYTPTANLATVATTGNYNDLSNKPVTGVSSVNGASGDVSLGDTTGIRILTTAPQSDNTSGVKFVVLSSEPANKYNGYIYLITN